MKFIALSSIASALMIAAPALAQTAPPPASPPPTAAPAPASRATPVAVAPAPAPSDHARFRGGIGLEGGQLIAPGTFNFTNVALDAQLGVQINNAVGIYVEPNLGAIVGNAAGLSLGVGLLADYTGLAGDAITLGGGVETKLAVAFGDTSGGGAFYGGVVHFAWNAVVGHGEDGVRRRALVIGVDVHLLVGPAIGAKVDDDGQSASANATSFALQPMLTLSYVAF